MRYGFIYLITNKINNKKYVGQTSGSIEERWRKHVNNSKNNPKKQVITQAIHKYGVNSFAITCLCKCQVEDLNSLETFYIEKYDTLRNGYNVAPGGGDYGTRCDKGIVETIIKKAQKEKTNYSKIAKEVGVSNKTVSKILKVNDVEIKHRTSNNEGLLKNIEHHQGKHNENLKSFCPVLIMELNKEFSSMTECANYLIENKIAKSTDNHNIMKSVSRAANGERKTYLGFHFKKSKIERGRTQ